MQVYSHTLAIFIYKVYSHTRHAVAQGLTGGPLELVGFGDDWLAEGEGEGGGVAHLTVAAQVAGATLATAAHHCYVKL